MPLTIEVNPDRRRVVMKGHGPVRSADFLEARRLLVADPSFDPAFDYVIDLLDADLHGLESSEIRELSLGSVFGDSSRRVFVASGALGYGLVRMFQSLSTRFRVEVFTDRPSADAWLDGKPDGGLAAG